MQRGPDVLHWQWWVDLVLDGDLGKKAERIASRLMLLVVIVSTLAGSLWGFHLLLSVVSFRVHEVIDPMLKGLQPAVINGIVHQAWQHAHELTNAPARARS